MGLELMTNQLAKSDTKGIMRPVSCTMDETDLKKLLQENMKHDGLVVCWQMQRIVWGRYQAGNLTFSDGNMLVPAYILELRVFNATEELHLVKKESTFTGRYRCDGEGPDQVEYVDTMAPLWGNSSKTAADGYVTLIDEERKFKMTIPCKEQANYYGLTTRNYIGIYEQTSQAGYMDYRFMGITPEKEEK